MLCIARHDTKSLKDFLMLDRKGKKIKTNPYSLALQLEATDDHLSLVSASLIRDTAEGTRQGLPPGWLC